jgi:hypothetical protein
MNKLLFNSYMKKIALCASVVKLRNKICYQILISANNHFLQVNDEKYELIIFY